MVLLMMPEIAIEELLGPGDMLIVEETIGIREKLLVDSTEEFAVREDTLVDTISELDGPAETPVPPDEELKEAEVSPLLEVYGPPKISVLKALTKLPPALEKVPGFDLR